MTSKADNELLTRTNAGTPMGELMRRYWIPAFLSAEIPSPDCPPVQVRLLGSGKGTSGRSAKKHTSGKKKVLGRGNATIPGGLYPNNSQDTRTFGVQATVVSSAKVPTEVVYQLVKAVFDNFEEFKKLHPALAVLKPEDMVKAGLTAPLHDGALKYYREKGWAK